MVTEKLKAEHQLILRWIAWMERVVLDDVQSDSGAADSLLLQQAELSVGFIRDYADGYHHGKEEDVLFRYLAHPGVLTECNPLPVMMSEHEAAREVLRQIQYAISLNDVVSLREQMRQYANLLKQHIFKEDNILYLMAERGLGENVKRQIIAEYAAIDDDPRNRELEQYYQGLLQSMI